MQNKETDVVKTIEELDSKNLAEIEVPVNAVEESVEVGCK